MTLMNRYLGKAKLPPGYTIENGVITNIPKIPPGHTYKTTTRGGRVATVVQNARNRAAANSPISGQANVPKANTNIAIPQVPQVQQQTRAQPTLQQGFDNIANAAAYEEKQFNRGVNLMRESLGWQLQNSREQQQTQKQLQQLRNLGAFQTQQLTNTGIVERQRVENEARLQESQDRLTGQLGASENQKAATLGAAQIGADANRDVARTNLAGTKFSAQKQFDAADLTSKRNLQGTIYDANSRERQEVTRGRFNLMGVQEQGRTAKRVAKTEKSSAITTQAIRSIGDYLSARENARAQSAADQARMYQAYLQGNAQLNFRYW